MAPATAPAAPAAPADARAETTMAGEAGASRGGAVGAPVVNSCDLNVHVVLPAVDIPILDTEVGEMDLAVEVRQVMFVRPLLDFALVTIRPSVVVVAVPIALVEPLLVLALELVVEPDALDAGTALLDEPLRLPDVSAIELGVMFQLAFTFQAGVERLVMAPFAVAVRLEQVPPAVGEDHGLLAIAGDADRLDEALFS